MRIGQRVFGFFQIYARHCEKVAGGFGWNLHRFTFCFWCIGWGRIAPPLTDASGGNLPHKFKDAHNLARLVAAGVV
jgi:hypothetical protein